MTTAALRAPRRLGSACYGLALAAPVLAGAALFVWLLLPTNEEQVIAAFSSGTRDRTRSQVHNVRLALASLDGRTVSPGGEFSFNQRVGPWGPDRGYVRAPVSFSGERVLDWGGGVCQASTVLYNTVLLAGLPVVERHRHYWPTTYVPAGQDAAVAYPNIDLRFRNTLSAPVRISARMEGETVVVKLLSRARPPAVRLERELIARTPAAIVDRPRGLGRGKPTRGFPGATVALYRVFPGDPERREIVSRDSYPAQSRVVYQ